MHDQPRPVEEQQSRPSAWSTPSGPPVVGIGASAGGLAALIALFEATPADSGAAFVVVVHLSPQHESHLAEVLQRHVRMPARQVTAETPLEPDQVYVIPPNHNLAAIDTHLRLQPLEAARRARKPIDHFFETLARTHGSRAVGVLLSGTGSDGAAGLAAIHDAGGRAIVQDPHEAEHGEMPREAIQTGKVDHVLPAAEIPAAALRFVHGTPAANGAPPRDPGAESLELLSRSFAVVHARTGFDFTGYSRTIVLRRILGRMRRHALTDLADYLAVLDERPDEAELLADDLLVAQARFLDDGDAFAALAHVVLPRLFEDKAVDDAVRVWDVGCGGGEEAYSVAMLLLEEADRRRAAPQVTVFGTDVHPRSIGRARAGRYGREIEDQLGSERLARFFRPLENGFVVRDRLRQRAVFSVHDVLRDPPFHAVDLVICRNLLLYLQRDVQRDVLELLHYALRPRGHLMVGRSEVAGGGDLFAPADLARGLLRKRDVGSRSAAWPRRLRSKPAIDAAALRDRPAAALLHQRMVQQHAPASMLIDAVDDIVHLSRDCGRYLVHPGGEPSSNALELVHPALRVELIAALQLARAHEEPSRSSPVLVPLEEGPSRVVVHAEPATDADLAGYVLVMLEPADVAPPDPTAVAGATVVEAESEPEEQRGRLLGLAADLHATRRELARARDELAAARAEQGARADELSVFRDAMRHAGVELARLRQVATDFDNLLAASDIATVFVDRELRILRFTPKLGELIHVQRGDEGRPLLDLASDLRYPELADDVRQALHDGERIEREVTDADGARWYLTRVLPYRDSVEEGEASEDERAVVTFVDITDRKRAEEAVRESDRRKGEFLATLAHELRNPLAALANGLSLFDLGGHDERTRGRVRTMMGRQLDHLVRLIDDLLDLSRISRDKLELRCQEVEAGSLIRQTVEAVAPRAVGRRLEISVADEPLPVVGDPVRLSQVIGNLLDNACEFTDAGDRIVVTARRDGDHVEIAVEDDGAGIPKDKLATIFDLFSQVATSRRRKQGGLGIGLSLVRRLVEMHGGTVSASSDGPGQGSRFVLRMPLRSVDAAPETRAPEPARPAVGRRILAVDDNPDILTTEQMLLEMAGHVVRVARDGEEALRTVEQWPADVVLLDIGLPGIDGYEVARRLRAGPFGRQMTLIAVSGWGQPRDRERSVEAGFDRHLVKPVDPTLLHRTLAELPLPEERRS